MNIPRLIVTVIVAFVTIWVTDFLIHAVWLSSTYGATKELWRPESEMISKMPFMLLGQFLVAAAFTMLHACFVAEKRSLKSTIQFASGIGVIVAAGQIIMYAVAPYPGVLVVQWCVAYIVQTILLGAVVHLVYKPRTATDSNIAQVA